MAGCGGPTPQANERSVAIVEAAEPGTWSHSLTFANGVTIDGIATPDRVEPGAAFEVRWRATGSLDDLRLRLRAWPPRAGSRQVALGGVGAPPPVAPIDPRVVELEPVALTEHGAATIELPAPWHPDQVLLTATLLDGDSPVPATAGPRRHDGVAQLALVDVVPRPTAVAAASTDTPVEVDGQLDEAVWQRATATELVHSLDGEPYLDRPGSVRFAWDAQALYVGAQIEDPDVWSQYTQRDDPLWKQEVFELFIFGDAARRGYLELQVSPRGTVFDARFDDYRKGQPAYDGAWRSAVQLRGTLDNRRDRDEGWSAELAVPWSEICEHTEVACPVAAGTSLRINSFRFERPEKRPAVGLALSPPRVPDFHAPENSAVLTLEAPK